MEPTGCDRLVHEAEAEQGKIPEVPYKKISILSANHKKGTAFMAVPFLLQI
jgi:hypothetical protein